MSPHKGILFLFLSSWQIQGASVEGPVDEIIEKMAKEGELKEIIDEHTGNNDVASLLKDFGDDIQRNLDEKQKAEKEKEQAQSRGRGNRENTDDKKTNISPSGNDGNEKMHGAPPGSGSPMNQPGSGVDLLETSFLYGVNDFIYVTPNLLFFIVMMIMWGIMFCCGFCCLFQIETPSQFPEKCLELKKEY